MIDAEEWNYHAFILFVPMEGWMPLYPHEHSHWECALSEEPSSYEGYRLIHIEHPHLT